MTCTERNELDEKPEDEDRLSIEIMPFRELIVRDKKLAELRRTYSVMTSNAPKIMAGYIYRRAQKVAVAQRDRGMKPGEASAGWMCVVIALAIDPHYAPAIVTVGTIEYQLGRREEALALFHSLVTLPTTTEDLDINIDDAGICLYQRGDYLAAADLYRAAARWHPTVAFYWNKASFCLGELGRRDEAVVCARRAVELIPDSIDLLKNLGWSLYHAHRIGEAIDVLERATKLVPSCKFDEMFVELIRENIEFMRRQQAELPS